MTRALINTTSLTSTSENARASEEKLQDAAHGGSPVAIPAAFEPKKSPVPATPPPNESFERAIPEDDDSRRDHELEGGGTPRTS